MTNQQELDARERAIHELEHEVERLWEYIDDKEDQITRLQVENERLRDDKNRLLSDLTVVIRERDELEAENERLRDTLSDEIRFSAERIARLQVERDGLREALERCVGQCDELEAERDEALRKAQAARELAVSITAGRRLVEAEEARDRYREALERYGRCRSDCELVRALQRGENPTVCSCGYQATLDRNRE